MPQLNETADPGAVSEIFVAVGDRVELGQRVLSVEMEKAVIDVEATAAGTVRSIDVSPGDEVQVGQVLMEIG